MTPTCYRPECSERAVWTVTLPAATIEPTVYLCGPHYSDFMAVAREFSGLDYSTSVL